MHVILKEKLDLDPKLNNKFRTYALAAPMVRSAEAAILKDTIFVVTVSLSGYLSLQLIGNWVVYYGKKGEEKSFLLASSARCSMFADG